MRNLANHILYRANIKDNPITNLQLQKISYFTLGYLINTDREDLAKKEFEKSDLQAWLYGPVVPELYEKYKAYKSTPIQDTGEEQEQFNQEDINNMIDKLLSVNPFTLVDMSHTHRGWKDNEKEIKIFGTKPSYKYSDLRETFGRK